MYDMSSIKSLKSELAEPNSSQKATPQIGLVEKKISPRRTAIFVIHGISPIQRYAIQDQFADGFFAFLSAQRDTWARAIHWPANKADADITPSAIRIYDVSSTNDPDDTDEAFDIFEGYWSPLSKGKATFTGILQWLLGITFLATSSTADLPCTFKKLRWDLGYFGVLLAICGALTIAAFVGAACSWAAFSSLDKDKVSFPSSISDFVVKASNLGFSAYAKLAILTLIGYCAVQRYSIARVRVVQGKRASVLLEDAQGNHVGDQIVRAAKWHTISTTVFLAFTVACFVALYALILWDKTRGELHEKQSLILGVCVLLTFAAAQSARFVATYIVDNVLGDVQVYTTHDTNAEFFAIRNQIINTVSRALVGVIKATSAPTSVNHEEVETPLYDSIHIAAHSLGTTIGLDVIMRLSMLVKEGSVSESKFARIKTFLTFGTALEKTKFLFDVAKPTMSAAHDQWDADVYGSLFDDRRDSNAIFWKNLWYERDIVANDILSYQSDVQAGDRQFVWGSTLRRVCSSSRIAHDRPFWAFVHGDYLGDAEFWRIAGPIFEM